MRTGLSTLFCVLALLGPGRPSTAAQDEPAEEARRIVAKHADTLDGEARRLKAKNEAAAEVLTRAAQALRGQLEPARERAAGDASTPYAPDLGPGGGPGRARRNPSMPAKAAVVSLGEFQKTYAAGYPREANLARGGRAVASSTHSDMDDPITVLGGVRKRDTWAMRGGKGWLVAEWPEPLAGRYVVLFNRPPGGNDPWDAGVLEINGRVVTKIGPFTRGQVLVVELGEVVAIKSVRLVIEGQENPGLAGLEIHRGPRR